jgi:hypothetical protein
VRRRSGSDDGLDVLGHVVAAHAISACRGVHESAGLVQEFERESVDFGSSTYALRSASDGCTRRSNWRTASGAETESRLSIGAT